VALSGTGGQLPQGPQGPQGLTGRTGPQGPAGPQGAAGNVICKNTAAASLLCSLLFAPGTWTTGTAPAIVTFKVNRAGRTIVSQRISVRSGLRSVRFARRLSPGRYLVTITIGHGRHRATLLRRTIAIPAAR
jgi:hypothetical protein